jgi:hypothetical protein
LFVLVGVGGFVDPGCCWQGGWFGVFAYESFGAAGVGCGEHVGSCGADGFGVSVVDVDRVVPADAGVVVLGVVPGEEVLAERPGVGDRSEGGGEVGPVLQGLELRF